MRRILCHSMPMLALALAGLGCFGSHGSGGGGGDRDAGLDAGPLPPADGSIPGADGSFVPDASPGACAPRPIDLACPPVLRAGVPSTLPVSIGGIDGCFCGETVSCDVSLSGPRTIELRTGLCTDGPLCDACFPFVEGSCALPPLAEGRYEVRVDGAYAFGLDVAPPDVVPEWGLECIRTAARDDDCGGPVPPPHYGGHGFFCHPDLAYPERRVPIRVTHPCGGCGVLAGPCEVSVFDDVIDVRPSSIASACDYDCPAICEIREDVCWTPPLPPGRYRVRVEGIAEERAIGVTAEGVPMEVCAPSAGTGDVPAR